MKPVSTPIGPSAVSTSTVVTWPPGVGWPSNSVTRWSWRRAQAAVSPLIPDPTIAMSMSAALPGGRAGGSIRERPLHAVARLPADLPERAAEERLGKTQQSAEVDVGDVLDPRPARRLVEGDLVGRAHRGALAAKHH